MVAASLASLGFSAIRAWLSRWSCVSCATHSAAGWRCAAAIISFGAGAAVEQYAGDERDAAAADDLVLNGAAFLAELRQPSPTDWKIALKRSTSECGGGIWALVFAHAICR